MALAPATAPAGMGMGMDAGQRSSPDGPDMAGAGGGEDTVLVTISKTADGSYVVYSGDEPDDAEGAGDGADMGGAPAPGGAMGSAAGQPADSIGAALKLAMDILQSDKSSEGAPGNADDQFSSGYSADKSPTPASGPSMR